MNVNGRSRRQDPRRGQVARPGRDRRRDRHQGLVPWGRPGRGARCRGQEWVPAERRSCGQVYPPGIPLLHPKGRGSGGRVELATRRWSRSCGGGCGIGKFGVFGESRATRAQVAAPAGPKQVHSSVVSASMGTVWESRLDSGARPPSLGPAQCPAAFAHPDRSSRRSRTIGDDPARTAIAEQCSPAAGVHEFFLALLRVPLTACGRSTSRLAGGQGRRRRSFRCARAARAALLPGAPCTPPPGCADADPR